MESPSVLLVPPDPLAVAEAYALGEPRGAATVAARGELGRIWRLETTSGTWAVKELLRFDPTVVESAARRDIAFQRAAVDAGIPMPHPVVSRAGDVTTVVTSPQGASHRVRVYTWLDLASREAVPDRRDVATILGRLHAMELADDRPVDPWYSVPPRPDRWPDLLQEASSQGVPWRQALADVVPVVAASLDAIPAGEMRSIVTCHLDFNPENVLVDTRGRTMVIDWENSGPATAEQELASSVAEFVADPAETRDFISAYVAAGGTGRLVDRSSFRMTVVVQANLVETYARLALALDSTPEDRARSAHWVEDIAAHAFTVDRIDAWLAAAGRHPAPRPAQRR